MSPNLVWTSNMSIFCPWKILSQMVLIYQWTLDKLNIICVSSLKNNSHSTLYFTSGRFLDPLVSILIVLFASSSFFGRFFEETDCSDTSFTVCCSISEYVLFIYSSVSVVGALFGSNFGKGHTDQFLLINFQLFSLSYFTR